MEDEDSGPRGKGRFQQPGNICTTFTGSKAGTDTCVHSDQADGEVREFSDDRGYGARRRLEALGACFDMFLCWLERDGLAKGRVARTMGMAGMQRVQAQGRDV